MFNYGYSQYQYLSINSFHLNHPLNPLYYAFATLPEQHIAVFLHTLHSSKLPPLHLVSHTQQKSNHLHPTILYLSASPRQRPYIQSCHTYVIRFIQMAAKFSPEILRTPCFCAYYTANLVGTPASG